MDAVYLKVLHERYKYFADKKITELTDVEIREYLILKEEILNAMPEVVDAISSIWETVKEYFEPYVEAELKYINKVRQSKG